MYIDKERDIPYVYTCIYIYIYRERERYVTYILHIYEVAVVGAGGNVGRLVTQAHLSK